MAGSRCFNSSPIEYLLIDGQPANFCVYSASAASSRGFNAGPGASSAMSQSALPGHSPKTMSSSPSPHVTAAAMAHRTVLLPSPSIP